MDKLIDFYKRTLESVGFKYNGNGNIIRVSSKGKEVVVMQDGKPMVLPTKEHVDTLVELDDNGDPCIKKILFNPLNEDMVKGDSHSLVKLKDTVSTMLNYSIFTSCILLLHVGKEKHLQVDIPMDVTDYLSSLSQIDRGNNVKVLIDDTTISNWEKIYDKMASDGFTHKSFINIFIKKRGRDSKGEMSNRLTVLNSNFLTDLEELLEEKTPVYMDIKLRPKDIKVYIATMRFILEDLDEKNNTLSIGSNDGLAPAFVSLFTTYLKVIEKPNKILKDLRFVNYDFSDSGYIDIKIKMDEILEVGKHKAALHSIPNDIEAHRMVTNYANTASQPAVQNQMVAQPAQVMQQPMNNQVASVQTPPSGGSTLSDFANNQKQRYGYQQMMPGAYPPQMVYPPMPQQQLMMHPHMPSQVNNGYVQMPPPPPQYGYNQPVYPQQNFPYNPMTNPGVPPGSGVIPIGNFIR